MTAPVPTNVFYFADGRELRAEHPHERPEIELVRVRRVDYLSFACGDRYRELHFALESIVINDEQDVATYREIVS